MNSKKYTYDAFISHSVADKLPVADQLYHQLEKAGLKIWYSGSELTTGDSISKTIQEGLAQSRYGIVILSPSYLQKLWPLQEFYVLWNREIDGQKVILPVLHDITPEDLALKSLDMADRWSTPTSKGLDKVTEDLVKAIQEDRKRLSRSNILKRSLWFAVGVLLIGLLSMGYYYRFGNDSPPTDLIAATIRSYINASTQKVEAYQLTQPYRGRPSTQEEITELYLAYNEFSSHYRNSYSFDDGKNVVQFKKNVNAALQIDVEQLTPLNNYSFESPIIHLWYDSIINGSREIKYSYTNTDSIGYRIEDTVKEKDQFAIDVRITPYLRYIEVHLQFPKQPGEYKIHEMRLFGLPQSQEFVFHKEGNWVSVPSS